MARKNRTTVELQSLAAKLHQKLEATGAEIIEREKTVDWPTARYVCGVVDLKYVKNLSRVQGRPHRLLDVTQEVQG